MLMTALADKLKNKLSNADTADIGGEAYMAHIGGFIAGSVLPFFAWRQHGFVTANKIICK